MTPRRPTYATAHLHLQSTNDHRVSVELLLPRVNGKARVASTGLGKAQANLPSVRPSSADQKADDKRLADRQIERDRALPDSQTYRQSLSD